MSISPVSTLLLLIAQEGKKPLDLTFIFMMFGIFIFFYVLIIRPAKKEQQEKEEMMGGLKKNDHVITSSGIYGVVMHVGDNDVLLRIDDSNKVKVRFVKAAIARVVGPEEAKKS